MRRTGLILSIVIVVGLSGILAAIIYGAFTYNRFVDDQNDIREKWDQITILYDERLEQTREGTTIQILAERISFETQEDISTVEKNWTNAKNVKSIEGGIQQAKNIDIILGAIITAGANDPVIATSDQYIKWKAKVNDNNTKIEQAADEYNQVVREYSDHLSSGFGPYLAGAFGFLQVEEITFNSNQ